MAVTRVPESSDPKSPRMNQTRFNRLDLAVLVGFGGLLAAWFVLTHSGERGRLARCSRNLAVLGQSMHSYANEHHGGQPPAVIGPMGLSWDTLLKPYLKAGFVVSNSAYAERQMSRAVAPRFRCPSDRLLREDPRSYVMSAHDMQPENWPPGPGNATGVGLWWTRTNIASLLAEASAATAQTADAMALVKLSWLPAPADTLVLTELFAARNILGQRDTASIAGASQQVAPFKGDLSSLHRARFNYLMADGHVEALTPYQAGALSDSAGIWTIKAGD